MATLLKLFAGLALLGYVFLFAWIVDKVPHDEAQTIALLILPFGAFTVAVLAALGVILEKVENLERTRPLRSHEPSVRT